MSSLVNERCVLTIRVRRLPAGRRVGRDAVDILVGDALPGESPGCRLGVCGSERFTKAHVLRGAGAEERPGPEPGRTARGPRVARGFVAHGFVRARAQGGRALGQATEEATVRPRGTGGCSRLWQTSAEEAGAVCGPKGRTGSPVRGV